MGVCDSTQVVFWITTSVFRLKKVITLKSICVSMYDILGIGANSSQTRNCEKCDHDLGLSLPSFYST